MSNEKKISIGMICHNPPFQGGVVQFCVLLANSLAGRIDLNVYGYQRLYPQFLYKGVLPEENRSAINFSCSVERSLKWYSPLSWYGVYRRLIDFDLIHIHWLTAFLGPVYLFILLLNKMGARKKVILTCHNITDHERIPFSHFFTSEIFKRTDVFVVHADENRVRLQKFYGIAPDQVRVIPHGNFSYFSECGRPLTMHPKEKLGFSTNDKVILFFGYIRKYKGVIYIIRAMEEVVKRFPNARLVIAGECWEDWNRYQTEIDSLNLQGVVKADVGYVNDRDVAGYFKAADVVVLPYFNEEQTISGPLLVSFAFGKPTIVGRCGGIGNMVRQEVDGILVEPGDVKGYARQIIRIFDDPELARKLGEEALKSIRNHEWHTVADHYIELYTEMAGC